VSFSTLTGPIATGFTSMSGRFGKMEGNCLAVG
jgi:hypothetical protein